MNRLQADDSYTHAIEVVITCQIYLYVRTLPRPGYLFSITLGKGDRVNLLYYTPNMLLQRSKQLLL